jgi:transcriptional regulator with XRE-family HTH domain
VQICEKLRFLRKRSGLTLDQLAKRCHMTKGYLSKLERNAQPPPVATLLALAQALGVEISEFFAEEPHRESGHPDLDLLRKDQRRSLENEGKAASYGYAYAPLVGSLRGKQMSPMLMKVHKGQTDAFAHDSEEFIYVTQGAVELLYDGTRYALEKGDSLYFDSRKKHRFINHQETPAILVTVNYNYRQF